MIRSLSLIAFASLVAVSAAQPKPQTKVQTKDFTPKVTKLPPPKFADTTARAVIQKAVARYKKLGGIQFTLEGGVPTRVAIQGLSFRESAGGVAWVHQNGTLTLSKNGVFLQGKAVRAEVLDYVPRYGRRVDPMVRAFLTRQNLIEAHYAVQGVARTIGNTSIRGQMVHLIEITSPGAKTVLAVRKDGLLQSVSTTIIERGRSMGTSERRFIYEKIGTLPASTFTLGKPPYMPLPKNQAP